MRIRIPFLFFIVLIPVFLASGCAKKEIKGNEDFKIISGKARIVSIVPSSDAGEPGMMNVFFDFIPEKSGKVTDYKYPQVGDKNIKLYQDHRENFHRNWIKKWDIKEGGLYSALRYERLNPARPETNVYFEILFDKGPQ